MVGRLWPDGIMMEYATSRDLFFRVLLQECCHLTLAHRYILELSSIICLEDIWRTKIAKDLFELLKNSVLILALQLSKPHERREMVLDGENVLVAVVRLRVTRFEDDEVNLNPRVGVQI